MEQLFATRPRRIATVSGIVVLSSVVTTLIVFDAWKRLLVPLAIAVLVLGAIFVAIHFGARFLRRRRQRGFDASVAAREGIDDRKREWQSWTEELERQGIDRYGLPFYLLVGEPQSGKSVLLQNSDLHFPFGQQRLSGVGGTRGCDWWFTEEAVVLDLAGRLFTHEGGESDAAEWEAFLELLASYRPLCPANGVLLVLPCDSLLGDGKDTIAYKASRIQNGLLTLTSRLQAQLPVYVVLTKGDRIFGFAESVHRLDAERRHEMFGWSRPAERYDAPFVREEVREGFGELVERARLLRAQMLATARLPEALPEVDRLYAFPDELAALWPAIELYLARIFSESALVDRVFFRGLYLTSGLQSGTPIARVCAELLGHTGEADERELEALFAKQHAYFIRDLVKRRVFSERGLVRPTRGRVARTRRNSWIGYGAAASIAGISIIASLAYVLRGKGEVAGETDRVALQRAGEEAGRPGTSVEVLAALEAVAQAAGRERRTLEEVATSTRDAFEELYVALFDRRLLPALRREAEAALAEDLKLSDYDAFRVRESHLRFLLGAIDVGRDEHVRQLSELLGGERLSAVGKALAKRKEYAQEPPKPFPRGGEPARLASAQEEVRRSWDGVLTPGSRLQVGWREREPEGAHLGYALAWMGARAAVRWLEEMDPASDWGVVHEQCARLSDSLERLRACDERLPKGADGKRLLDPARTHELLGRLVEERSTLFPEQAAWQLAQAYEGFAQALDGAEVPVPGGELEAILGRSELLRASKLLPRSAWEPRRLLQDLQAPSAPADSSDAVLAGKVLRAKVRALHEEFRQRYATPAELAGALDAAGAPGLPDDGLVGYLADLRDALSALDARDGLLDGWRATVEGLLLEHLRAVDPARAEEDALASLQAAFPALGRCTPGAGGELAARAAELTHAYLRAAERALMDGWRADALGAEQVMAQLSQLLAAVAPTGADDEHRAWLEDADALLAGRLRDHCRDVETYARPGPLLDLSQAAAELTSRFSRKQEIEEWQAELEVELVPDPQAMTAIPPAELARLPRTAAAWEDFRRLGKRLVTAVEQKRALQPAVEYFQGFADDAVAQDGPRLARVFHERPPFWEAQDWQPASAIEQHATLCGRDFHEKLVETLRELYVEDLHKLWAEPEAAPVLDALWAGDEASLGKVSDQLGLVTLPAFLGGNGKLRRQVQRYGLEPRSRGFRPSAEEAAASTSTDRRDWLAEIFLLDLSAFLYDPVEEGGAARERLLLHVSPMERREGTVWTSEPRFSTFYVGDGVATQNTRILDVMNPVPIDWSLDPRRKSALSLRWDWNDPNASENVAELEVGSSLAPLLLAWTGQPAPNPDHPRHASRWTVDRLTPKGSELGAGIVLEFKRDPIPVRPERP